jgi:hypothetical protein
VTYFYQSVKSGKSRHFVYEDLFGESRGIFPSEGVVKDDYNRRSVSLFSRSQF